MLPNGPEMALVLLAAMSVGCAAPLNPKYREEEFRFYLDDLRAAALVTDGQTPAALAAAPQDTIAIAVHGEGLSIDLAGPAAERRTHRWPSDRRPTTRRSCCTRRAPRRDPRSCPSASATWPGRRATSPLPWSSPRPTARSTVMPLFHIHGIMAGLLAPLSAGGSRRVHARLRRVQVPPLARRASAHLLHGGADDAPDGAGPSAGAAARRPCASSVPRRRRCRGRCSRGWPTLFGVPVIEAYGMTEASHQMTCNPLPPGVGQAGLGRGRRRASRWRSSTRRATSCPPGERGEVAIRGATVVDGYENNAAANEAAFTAGWFRTGDEGMLDDEGYLFLTGRLKEQINRGGEKISPLEIDEVLLRHPAVAEAVTFAIPHDKLGEEVGAAVVLADGHERHRARAADLPARPARRVQGAQADRVRRRDPQRRHRQDPTHRPRRADSPSERERFRVTLNGGEDGFDPLGLRSPEAPVETGPIRCLRPRGRSESICALSPVPPPVHLCSRCQVACRER